MSESKTPFIDQFLRDSFPPERIEAANRLSAAVDDLAHKQLVLAGAVRDPVVEALINERLVAMGKPPREWPPLTEPEPCGKGDGRLAP